MATDNVDGSEWDQHEDRPILLNASFFERMPFNNWNDKDAFRKFTIIYATRMEEHITHLVGLLATKGITCQCTDLAMNPQCLIHVRDNV